MIITVQYHSLKRAQKLVSKNELRANLDRAGKSFRLRARFSLAAAFSGSTSKLSFPRLHFLRLHVEANFLRLYVEVIFLRLFGGREFPQVELSQVVRKSELSQVVHRR